MTRGGDADAVERAFRAHGTAILGYLARRVDPVDDAADLFGEVILTAWRRRDAMPPAPQDLLWLYGVARNVLSNHRRSTRRRAAGTQALADELRTATAVARDVGAIGADVRAAIRTLGATDREILLLSDWDGRTSAEIAVIVDMPSSTVRSRLARARGQVRQRLGSEKPV